MKKQISVYIKHSGASPERTTIDNTLEALQKLVGGYIEVVTLSDDICVICNEEGALKGLPYNTNIGGNAFVGTVIYAGIDGEDFDDLSDSGFVKVLVKTRNEALFSLDKDIIKRYMNEWCNVFIEDDTVFWATVYKAICNIKGAPEKLVRRSKMWLSEHGMTPNIL